MIYKAYRAIDYMLGSGKIVHDIPDCVDPVMIDRSSVDKIVGFMLNNEPERYTLNSKKDAMNLFRQVYGFKARQFKSYPICYGVTELELSTMHKEKLDAVWLYYFEEDENRSFANLPLLTQHSTVLVMEDGTIGWYYRTSKSPLTHTGCTYCPIYKLNSGLPYPENPKDEIRKFIEDKMLDFIANYPEDIFANEKRHGKWRHLPQKESDALIIANSPKIKFISAEQFVQMSLDSEAFGAMLELIELAIKEYQSDRWLFY